MKTKRFVLVVAGLVMVGGVLCMVHLTDAAPPEGTEITTTYHITTETIGEYITQHKDEAGVIAERQTGYRSQSIVVERVDATMRFEAEGRRKWTFKFYEVMKIGFAKVYPSEKKEPYKTIQTIVGSDGVYKTGTLTWADGRSFELTAEKASDIDHIRLLLKQPGYEKSNWGNVTQLDLKPVPTMRCHRWVGQGKVKGGEFELEQMIDMRSGAVAYAEATMTREWDPQKQTGEKGTKVTRRRVFIDSDGFSLKRKPK